MTRLMVETIKEWRIFELAYFVKDEHRRGEWREVGGVCCCCLLRSRSYLLCGVLGAPVRRSWWLLQTAAVPRSSATRLAGHPPRRQHSIREAEKAEGNGREGRGRGGMQSKTRDANEALLASCVRVDGQPGSMELMLGCQFRLWALITWDVGASIWAKWV